MNGSRADRQKGWKKGKQKKPPVNREGVGDTYGCTRKGIGGGGADGRDGEIQYRQINPRSSMRSSTKSKIIKGVAVYGQDDPRPPLPSTTRCTGRRGDISNAMYARKSQGRPAKHLPGADSEGSTSIWCPDKSISIRFGGEP